MNKLELQKMANEVRKGILTGVHAAKAGHPGGSLSAAEVFTTTITGTAFSSNVLFIDFVSSGLTVVHAGYTSPRSSSTVSVVAMSKIPTPQYITV